MQSKNQTVYTNKAKCRDCYRCVSVCPVNAIKMENSQAMVLKDRCISCGTCVYECPQNAKAYSNELGKVLSFMESGNVLAASVAPAFASVYSGWQQKRFPSVLRALGFSIVSETARGAYYVSVASAEHIAQNPNKLHLTTACPAFVSYIEKYRPEFVKNLVPVVSPMVAHARLIKQQKPNCKVVFIGPCIAKIEEAQRRDAEPFVDAVLTFAEFDELLQLKNISFENCEESVFETEPGLNARLYPLEGGLLKTAGISTDMLQSEVVAVSGIQAIDDMLTGFEGKNYSCAVEPLFCAGGCINGPVLVKNSSSIRKRRKIIEYNSQNPGIIGVPDYENKTFKGSYFGRNQISPKIYTDTEIFEVLKKTGKDIAENNLNCQACGYKSCRDKAIAVLDGIAEEEMCIPYMRRQAEHKSDLIIEKAPNGMLLIDSKLTILQMNPAFMNMFSCSPVIVGKPASYLIDPTPFERLIADDVTTRREIKYVNYNLAIHLICYTIKDRKSVV